MVCVDWWNLRLAPCVIPPCVIPAVSAGIDTHAKNLYHLAHRHKGAMHSEKLPNSGRHIIQTPWARWTLLIAAWTAFGLFMSAEWYFQALRAGNPVSLGKVVVSEMLYAYVWLALTPPILWLAWKYPFHRSKWPSVVALHLGATVFFTFTHRFVFNVILEAVMASPEHPFLWDDVFSSLSRYVDYGIMICWILILFRQAIGYYRQVQHQALQKSELEAQLNLAQLRALKTQLQPHFLFNTLNGISVLVRRDPEAACSMIAKLADLLRMTLENTGSQEVPLDQELKTLGCYLEIEQMRFADRLSVTMAIGEETRCALVPNLILQPLVENALLHGIAKQRGPAVITIRSSRRNSSLEIEVEDTGPGMPSAGEVREGIGISNTRSRLERLYQDRFTFSVENLASSSGARARITIPFQTAAQS